MKLKFAKTKGEAKNFALSYSPYPSYRPNPNSSINRITFSAYALSVAYPAFFKPTAHSRYQLADAPSIGGAVSPTDFIANRIFANLDITGAVSPTDRGAIAEAVSPTDFVASNLSGAMNIIGAVSPTDFEKFDAVSPTDLVDSNSISGILNSVRAVSPTDYTR